MQKTMPTENEVSRLMALYQLDLLDSHSDHRFQRVVELATHIAGCPIGLVSLIDKDRQWFKAKVGIEVNQTSRDISFCGHTIQANQPLIVADTTSDERFSDNPLVTGEPHIRFYAGIPLTMNSGHNIGTLCVINTKAQVLDNSQIARLVDLANILVDEIQWSQRVNHDLDTGFLNQTSFKKYAKQLLHSSESNHLPIVSIHWRCFGFERLSHFEQSQVLSLLATIIRQYLPDDPLIGRLYEFDLCLLSRIDPSRPILVEELITRPSQALLHALPDLASRIEVSAHFEFVEQLAQLWGAE